MGTPTHRLFTDRGSPGLPESAFPSEAAAVSPGAASTRVEWSVALMGCSLANDGHAARRHNRETR